jgi:hypothetical protein
VRSRPDADAARVFLAGHGGGAVVALHAAAVEEGVRGVEHDAGLACGVHKRDSPSVRAVV